MIKGKNTILNEVKSLTAEIKEMETAMKIITKRSGCWA